MFHNHRNRYISVVLFLLCASSVSSVSAQLPSTTLAALQPPGGKVGSTFEVSIASATNAEGADRLLFSHPGIKAVAKTEPSVLFPGKEDVVADKFIVTVGPDVPTGIYDVRLAGPLGVSNPRGFAIDELNEIAEVPGNRPADKAQPIEIGSVVSGKFEANSEHWFKFSAKKGTRVLIDVFAQRLDSKADATLVIYDGAGRELARNRDAHRRDPFIDLVIPADGDYLVKAYDFVFAGGPEHFYRLAVHTGPHIDFVFPPVVQPGKLNKLTVYGRNLPGGTTSEIVVNGRPLDRLEVTVDVPADEPSDRRAAPSPVRAVEALVDGREYRLNTSAGRSNAVVLGYARAPVIVETEPNDTLEKTPTVTLPCEVVGQFFPRGDLDAVQFEAKKGDVVAIEVISQRLGFACDPWLLVQRVEKKADGTLDLKDVKEVDDETTNIGSTAFNGASGDPYFRLTAPQDGTYRVTVRDLYGDSRGDPRLIYRLVIHKPEPDFRLIALPVTLAKGSNNTTGVGYRAAGFIIRSGEVSPISVMAARIDGFDGPVRLSVEGLPSGVTAPEAILAPKSDLTPLTIVVPENTPAWEGTVRIVGRATIDGREVRHEARAGAILAPGDTKRSAEARMTQEFTLAVGGNEAMPCMIQAGDGQPLSVERGAKVTLPVKMIRRGDFKDSVALTPIGLPSYVKTAAVTVGEKEMTLSLDVSKDAPVGELTFALSGVIPKFNYARDKAAVEEANKRKDEATQAAAELAKAVDEAKKLAAAVAKDKDKKAEADQAVAVAAEKVKQAAVAKKAIDAYAAAMTRAGQPKSVNNVPVVSTLITLKITDPAPKVAGEKK